MIFLRIKRGEGKLFYPPLYIKSQGRGFLFNCEDRGLQAQGLYS